MFCTWLRPQHSPPSTAHSRHAHRCKDSRTNICCNALVATCSAHHCYFATTPQLAMVTGTLGSPDSLDALSSAPNLYRGFRTLVNEHACAGAMQKRNAPVVQQRAKAVLLEDAKIDVKCVDLRIPTNVPCMTHGTLVMLQAHCSQPTSAGCNHKQLPQQLRPTTALCSTRCQST